ncbi:hypothetical protein FACS1894109_12140 [Spirochaetia bacterium]|nr:hypothetical protein FACS1894109_12140 [Spirochaetia bacterium]
MFRKNALLRNTFSLFAVFTLVMGALSLVGCDTDNGGDPDHELNEKLVGTWFADFGGGYTDTYIVTKTAISHPDGFPAYKAASIEYVDNFSNTAGCIIIKRTEDDKYTAVFFKDLSANTVLLGDAFGPAPDYADPGVATLELARERFKPENAENWGGGSAQGGTPQTRRP